MTVDFFNKTQWRASIVVLSALSYRVTMKLQVLQRLLAAAGTSILTEWAFLCGGDRILQHDNNAVIHAARRSKNFFPG